MPVTHGSPTPHSINQSHLAQSTKPSLQLLHSASGNIKPECPGTGDLNQRLKPKQKPYYS